MAHEGSPTREVKRLLNGTHAPQLLLLDFDGVLRRWPPHQLDVERRYGLSSGAIHSAAFEPELLSQVITGRMDDESWRTHVRLRLSEEIGEYGAASAVTEWSESPGELDAGVLAVLDQYDIAVILATNATSRLSDDLRRLRVQDRFLHVVNSSECRLRSNTEPRAAVEM
jgi:FMN phosphatase YigB (HAD superfamily)